MSQDSVVIVSAARTPMGGMMGAFGGLSSVELGSVAVREAVSRAGLSNDDVDELLFGCVLPANLGQAPARQVALGADLASSTPCTTVNKVCGSGMKTVMIAHDQILAGSSAVAVAGGLEGMSGAPHMLPSGRAGLRFGHGQINDHMLTDGLEDVYSKNAMGVLAQATADENSLTREEMDDYAIESLRRANEAIEKGHMEAEIAPVTLKSRKGETVVAIDEQPGNARPDKIPSLRPAFAKDGTLTAANSSSISDGAAALVLMKESEAQKRGLQPLARIVSHASHAEEPKDFAVAPAGAMKKVLEKSNWSTDDVDLFEINEAFAAVSILGARSIGAPLDKVNINGGACALGHPLGASGARIIVTLLHALKRTGGKKGLASLCIGGGEATAITVEMV